MSAIQEGYRRAWQHVLAITDGVDAGSWDMPRPMHGLGVGHLVGHIIDGAGQINAMLDGDPPSVPVGDSMPSARAMIRPGRGRWWHHC